MSILTCPTCGSSSCPIFYGMTLISPNFDTPNNWNIELKYICSHHNNKMLSIDLNQYIKIIELNSQFYDNTFENEESIYSYDNTKIINLIETKEQLIKLDIESIIKKYENIILLNRQEINQYINNKICSEASIFFLKKYMDLNDSLFNFVKIFLDNACKFKTNNLLISFYYIYKLIDYYRSKDKTILLIKENIIGEYMKSNDISKLPFIIKVSNSKLRSKGSEILLGHTLPIVGLAQMRNGLILTGSCGIFKIWKKNDNIKDNDYNKFINVNTHLFQIHLIKNFIELEDDHIVFIKGNQIIEAIINDKGEYKEIFAYKNLESSIYSFAAINQNKNFATGSYKSLYIYERMNPSPIKNLKYHEIFVMGMINIPKLNLFCSSGSDGKIIIYNSTNFDLFQKHEMDETHIICLCNYNDKEFCASTMNGKIWYFKWDENNNIFNKIGPIDAHSREIYGINQIKNGQVVSVSRDGSIKFWDILKQICVLQIDLEKKEGSYDHIIQLNDGRLCFGSSNHKIKIFNDLPFS